MTVTLAKRSREAFDAPSTARTKMQKFVIEGGVPLSGTVTPAGNKNGALPILAASVLTEEEVVVRNVPRIRDVETMLELLARLGVSVAWRGARAQRLDPPDHQRRPARRRGVHGRAVGDGDRERPDGGGADAGDDRD